MKWPRRGQLVQRPSLLSEPWHMLPPPEKLIQEGAFSCILAEIHICYGLLILGIILRQCVCGL